MDLRQARYPTLDELLLYCYRVAGTVGLMMAHVMGVSERPGAAPGHSTWASPCS